MASDDIVQTIKIEVEGEDKAADALKGVADASRDVNTAAGQAGKGTESLGGGLDQVTKKGGLSRTEMRALGGVMRELGLGEAAGLGIQLTRMAAAFGALGVAVLASAAAWSYFTGRLKEAEGQAKQTAASLANLAKISAEMHAETEASGRTAYTLIAGDPVAMKENANNLGHVADQLKRIESGASEIISPMTSVDTLLKALVLNTEKLTGLRFDKLTGGTKELNAAMYQLQLEAARTYEKMDVIQKANFEEAMKKAKWPDDVIKSIEKGADAFKKAHDEAEAFKASAPGQALDEFDAAVERSQKQLEDWGQALKIWFVKEVLEIKAMPQAISEAAIAMANSVMDNFINPLVDAFNRFVQTIENAFTSVSETITNAFNAIWGPIQSVLDQIGSAIDYLVGKAQALMSAIGGLLGGGGGGEVQGHAAGGVVGGAPGVDQNLALLSRGEFVLKVAAVQKYGLGFLHGLNTLQAPRFAAGGLNVGAIGHSAATSPRVLNLTIEGQSFAGMSVPENTAAALERFAVHSQIASTGRKQSWRR